MYVPVLCDINIIELEVVWMFIKYGSPDKRAPRSPWFAGSPPFKSCIAGSSYATLRDALIITSMDVALPKRASETPTFPPRKRFKASDLPLTQLQRSAIDNLLHTFKKRGEFDALRKKAYAQFETSDAKTTLTTSLTELAEAELERNPSLLAKDRRQAAPLIEGATERSEIYRIAEKDVDRLIDEFVSVADGKLREIRREVAGDEVAEKEERRGGKGDEEYALDADMRRQARTRVRAEELERERERGQEEKRLRAEVRRRKQEEEEALEKERREAEEKRRLEREAERKREEDRQREHEKEMEERRERKKRQDAEWERERQMEREKKREMLVKEHEKEIEAAALEELIRESKALAAQKEAVESPNKKLGLKSSATKESALLTIMREEKRKSEQAKATKVDDSQAIPNDSAETERRESSSTQERPTERDHKGNEFTRPPSRAEKIPESPRPSSRHESRAPLQNDDYYDDDDERSRRLSVRSHHREPQPGPEERKYYKNISWRKDGPPPRSGDHHHDDRRPPTLPDTRHIPHDRSASHSSTIRPPSTSEYHRHSASHHYNVEKDHSRRSRTPPSRQDRDRRDRPRSPAARPRRERSRSPPGIDRYVPSSSSRSAKPYNGIVSMNVLGIEITIETETETEIENVVVGMGG